MHKLICQKAYRSVSDRCFFFFFLFKIGVVWEDVDEILNHSVAEVVLLLKGKKKKRKEKCVKKCLQTTQTWGSFCTAGYILSGFFHLPQSEPCVVSACVNSWLSERRPGGPQLSPSPECYWGRWRFRSDPRQHWNMTDKTISNCITFIYFAMRHWGNVLHVKWNLEFEARERSEVHAFWDYLFYLCCYLNIYLYNNTLK